MTIFREIILFISRWMRTFIFITFFFSEVTPRSLTSFVISRLCTFLIEYSSSHNPRRISLWKSSIRPFDDTRDEIKNIFYCFSFRHLSEKEIFKEFCFLLYTLSYNNHEKRVYHLWLLSSVKYYKFSVEKQDEENFLLIKFAYFMSGNEHDKKFHQRVARERKFL